MDWPASEDPFLRPTENNLRLFRYEDSEFNSRLLRNSETSGKYSSLGLPTNRDDAHYQRWEQWIQSESLQEATEGGPRDVTDRSGYHILLSARVLPVQLTPLIPHRLNYLPIHKEIWRMIVQRFRPHNVILKALRMKTSYTAWLSSNTGNEAVELFTAVVPVGPLDGIAISSTYFIKSKLTLAVIYGCSREQMDRLEALLQRSPEVRSHPFLMAGLFAELQRDRVELFVQGIESELDDILSDELLYYREGVLEETQALLDRSTNRRVTELRRMARRLESEVQNLKWELEKLRTHMEISLDDDSRTTATTQLDPGRGDTGSQAASSQLTAIPQAMRAPTSSGEQTKRFIGRFKEIGRDLDFFLGRARDAAEEMTFARQVVGLPPDTDYPGRQKDIDPLKYLDELARREARDTARQTKSATVVGFVAMVYLPITAMATIFATPVFDFKNDWRDLHYQAIPSPDDKNATGQQSLPVVSGYFWYYVSSSMAFSVITLLAWWLKTQRGSEYVKVEPEDGRFGLTKRMRLRRSRDLGAKPARGGIVTDGVWRGSQTSSEHGSRDWSWKIRSLLGIAQRPEQNIV